MSMKAFKITLVAILMLIFSHFMSLIAYINWGGRMDRIACAIIFIIVILNRKKIPYVKSSKYLILLMLIPFVSIFSSFTLHNQSIVDGVNSTFIHLTYMFLFLLFIFDTNKDDLLKVIIVLGIVWCCIQIFQQISYPKVLFGTRFETFYNEIEIRNGIYRYNVTGVEFALILLFYCFEQFLRKGRTLNILGLLLACIGIYLLTTRQVIFAAILCMAYAMFALKKIKLNSFVFIIIFCYIVYMYSQNLFGYFIEMTEGIDKDYVRFLSYRFLGLDYNDGQVLPFLIGNGMWSDSSEYGYDMLRYADYGLHQSDIGIVGMYSLYGIFYVIVIILFFIYLIKRFKYIDVYLRMYAIYMLITSIMLHHFGSSSYKIMILCCYVYLVEKSVIHHKSIKQQIKLYDK